MKEFGRGGAHYGSFIVDGQGTILGFDQSLEDLTGWPAIDIVGHGKEIVTPGGGARGRDALCTVPLYEGRITSREREGRLVLVVNCRDGRRLDCEVSTRPLEGPGERVHVALLRVLALSAPPADAPSSERRDPLTGLLDGGAFASRLATELGRASRSARPLALLLLDIDHLRETNDRLGREAGDEVLRKTAGILRVTIEDESRIARIGKDDFGVLLPGAGRGEARRTAAALRSTVERFRFFGEETSERARVTVSLGAASYPADADSQNELIDRAREALDEARAMGRNRVWCYLRRPRVPLQVPVYFDGAHSSLVGYTRDLSPSGIFVQTTTGIEVGMRCALAFPLPGCPGKVHVVGRIVRTVLPETAPDTRELRIPGLGVEFERFGGDNDRRAIERYLHAHEATTLRPEDGTLSM